MGVLFIAFEDVVIGEVTVGELVFSMEVFAVLLDVLVFMVFDGLDEPIDPVSVGDGVMTAERRVRMKSYLSTWSAMFDPLT